MLTQVCTFVQQQIMRQTNGFNGSFYLPENPSYQVLYTHCALLTLFRIELIQYKSRAINSQISFSRINYLLIVFL